MRFIIDTQLPFKLAMYLRDQGLDALHTTDTAQGHLLLDNEIIKISQESTRIIVTKDADFHDHYYRMGAPPRVLYLTFGNVSNKDLMHYFDKYISTLLELYAEGAEFIEFNQEGIFLD